MSFVQAPECIREYSNAQEDDDAAEDQAHSSSACLMISSSVSKGNASPKINKYH
jgi:hypothetical protein